MRYQLSVFTFHDVIIYSMIFYLHNIGAYRFDGQMMLFCSRCMVVVTHRSQLEEAKSVK